jgi:flavin-dependent dehydrogenase
VLVIGAGPAGALAARSAARTGARVLLVDRAAFPRSKVCGCCLSAAALALLEQAGLTAAHALTRRNPLTVLDLICRRLHGSIVLPPGAAISREVFDQSLVEAAVAAGARFLPRVSVRLGSVAREEDVVVAPLTDGGSAQALRARAAIITSGLFRSRSDVPPGFTLSVRPGSRMGLGAALPASASDLSAGRIRMCVDRDVYVGLVKLEDGRINIAAAVDSRAVQRQGGAIGAVDRLLRRHVPSLVELLPDAPWRGAPRLTARLAPSAGNRIFIAGDAAGYVEPFTGEGMTWALASGLAVGPLAAASALEPQSAAVHERAWREWRASQLGRRMRSCRFIRQVVHRPEALAPVLTLLRAVPAAGRWIVESMNAPYDVHTTGTVAP